MYKNAYSEILGSCPRVRAYVVFSSLFVEEKESNAPFLSTTTRGQTTSVCYSLLCVPVFVKHSGRSGKNEISA